jgi:hypothetical protein
MSGKPHPFRTLTEQIAHDRRWKNNPKLLRKNIIRLYRAGYYTLDFLRSELAEKGGFLSPRELEVWIEVHTAPDYKPRNYKKEKAEEFTQRSTPQQHSGLATFEDLLIETWRLVRTDKERVQRYQNYLTQLIENKTIITSDDFLPKIEKPTRS